MTGVSVDDAAPHGSLASCRPLFQLDFLAAGFLQGGKIRPRQLPYDWRSNALIVVAQHVADACYFPPRNARVTGLHLVGEVAACFGNNLDTPFHDPLSLPVILENLERHIPQYISNAFDRLDEIGQARSEGALRRQNTRTAVASICGRKILCKLSRVMTSAVRPRMLAV